MSELVVVKLWDELGGKVVCEGLGSIGMERYVIPHILVRLPCILSEFKILKK